MALTLALETPARLGVTIPTVAVPIVSWLGVGNLVSVLHPVSAEPLIRRLAATAELSPHRRLDFRTHAAVRAVLRC